MGAPKWTRQKDEEEERRNQEEKEGKRHAELRTQYKDPTHRRVETNMIPAEDATMRRCEYRKAGGTKEGLLPMRPQNV
eukprot:872930-Pyramimonas_sp.AAC.1